MKIIGWIKAKFTGFCKYLASDIRNLVFFILSLPSLFALFLVIVFTTGLIDSFLYKEQKDKDKKVTAHETDIVYLDQGWLEGYRQKYYFTPQGSHIIPMDMALSLESPNSEEMIFGENGTAITKFGYLAYPKTDKDGRNPYGLPIGFVEDEDRSLKEKGGEYKKILGMNCSACHTANIQYGDKTLRVDGGAALSDFMGLIGEIDDALLKTLSDAGKLERYKNRRKIDEAEAITELGVASAKRQAWQRRNSTNYEHGFARVDAFGIIFNQVVGRDLHLDTKGEQGNVRTPEAPASYPVLWDTPYMGRVQWTGGSNNKKTEDPLARNFGQVLGVFGGVEMTTQNKLPGMCSTPNRQNLELYNFWLESLKSPKWKEAADKGVLPKLDEERVARGRAIYFGGAEAIFAEDMEQGCAACHSVISEEWRNKPREKKAVCDVPIHMISHEDVQTDRGIIDTGRRSGAKTGRLAGHKSMMPPKRTIKAEEDYLFVLSELIAGSLVGSFQSATCDGKLGASTLIETASSWGKINRKEVKHKFEKRVGTAFSLAPSDLEEARNTWINASEMTAAIDAHADVSNENRELAQANKDIAKANLDKVRVNLKLVPEGINLPPDDPTLFQIDLNKAIDIYDEASDYFDTFKPISTNTSYNAKIAKANYELARKNKIQAEINEAPAPVETKVEECRDTDNYSSYAYKARPLNGVWASAPYLHNGSVPTLYDMLLPPLNADGSCDIDRCRPDEFYVGSIKFDPVHVGYEIEKTEMSKILDTNDKGSSNAGHLYPQKGQPYSLYELNHEQRLDLVEYLKSL